MKNYLKLLFITITLISLGSCNREDEIVVCTEIYIPLVANIKYVDSKGKDLIFGDNPIYPPEDIKIYKILANDQTEPLTFTINKSAKFLTVNLEKVERGTFYIELKSGVSDKISYSAKIDESSPCKDFKLIDIKQNDVFAQYDGKNQVWILQK